MMYATLCGFAVALLLCSACVKDSIQPQIAKSKSLGAESKAYLVSSTLKLTTKSVVVGLMFLRRVSSRFFMSPSPCTTTDDVGTKTSYLAKIGNGFGSVIGNDTAMQARRGFIIRSADQRMLFTHYRNNPILLQEHINRDSANAFLSMAGLEVELKVATFDHSTRRRLRLYPNSLLQLTNKVKGATGMHQLKLRFIRRRWEGGGVGEQMDRALLKLNAHERQVIGDICYGNHDGLSWLTHRVPSQHRQHRAHSGSRRRQTCQHANFSIWRSA